MPQIINLNNTNPAAPVGKKNVAWQAIAPNADPTVARDVSAYVDTPPVDMTNVAGGLVPTPPNDATKYLDGTGVFSTPAGGGGSSFADNETPGGTSPNLTLANTPITGSVRLYGTAVMYTQAFGFKSMMMPMIEGHDFTISGTAITLIGGYSVWDGVAFSAWYRY